MIKTIHIGLGIGFLLLAYRVVSLEHMTIGNAIVFWSNCLLGGWHFTNLLEETKKYD